MLRQMYSILRELCENCKGHKPGLNSSFIRTNKPHTLEPVCKLDRRLSTERRESSRGDLSDEHWPKTPSGAPSVYTDWGRPPNDDRRILNGQRTNRQQWLPLVLASLLLQSICPRGKCIISVLESTSSRHWHWAPTFVAMSGIRSPANRQARWCNTHNRFDARARSRRACSSSPRHVR